MSSLTSPPLLPNHHIPNHVVHPLLLHRLGRSGQKQPCNCFFGSIRQNKPLACFERNQSTFILVLYFLHIAPFRALTKHLAPFSEHSAICATEHPCLFSDHPHACLPTPLLGVSSTTIHFQVFTTVDDRLNPDSKRFCEPYAWHCLRMLTYAGRMLTYAGRMLTYADVRGLWNSDRLRTRQQVLLRAIQLQHL